jgi:hypothetical protein
VSVQPCCTIPAIIFCPHNQAWLRKEVTAAVFQALYDLQHPANCSTAKHIYCQLGKNCGFGCQLHHVVHCFAIAVALNRTMVVNVSVNSHSSISAAVDHSNTVHLQL